MMDPRYCVKCKYMIGMRHQIEGHIFWKCGAKENIASVTLNEVTGMEEKKLITETCVQARAEEASCGPTGKWFELYVPDRYIPANPSGPREPKAADADALLSKLGI